MSPEAARALMFPNFEKYARRSSVFDKVGTIDLQLYYKLIPSKMFSKVFNPSTESEAYPEPC